MKSFWRSVRHAFRGIVYAIRNERNFQIECVAAVAVVLLACFFPLSSIERTLIVFLAGWVMAFELIAVVIGLCIFLPHLIG